MRYALQRLWNPRTEKGLFAMLRQGPSVKLLVELLEETDKFFAALEAVCEELAHQQSPQQSQGSRGRPAHQPRAAARKWTELRLRRAEVIRDNLTLPIQRLREAVSQLIELSEDKDTGQELMECNRRLAELREGVAMFLGQTADDHVYWVERAGKTQKNLTLNAAPVDVAEFFRQRLFGAATSVVMTSATLATRSAGRALPAAGGTTEPAPRATQK